jgi:hypothetical protein
MLEYYYDARTHEREILQHDLRQVFLSCCAFISQIMAC